MKLLKKAVAAALAVGVMATATSCSDMSWSYKDDKTTLPVGTYIYYMTGAYSYVQQTAQSEVEVTTDAEGATQATEAVDVLTSKITGDDDKEIVGKDYILNTAEQSSKTLIYTLEKFDELGLTLTDEQQSQIDATASQGWTYSGTVYEKLGVSQASYKLAYAEFQVKYEAVFKAMYGEGGEKEVSVDALKKYYTDNYVDYYYLPLNLYTTETATDENGKETSTATAFSEDEVKKANELFDTYKEQLNKGEKTVEDIDSAFIKEKELKTSPSVSNQENLDNSSISADIVNALKKLENKTATVITVGEGDSAILYLVYRGDISKKTSNLDDKETGEDLKYSLLAEYKSDEYNDYMDEQASKLDLEVNEAALNKYTPEEIDKKMKEISSENSAS